MSAGRARWVWAAALVLLLGSVGLWQADIESSTGSPVGAHDYVAFWSAFDVATDGGDPYDEATLRAAEAEVHPRYEGGAQRFWNPPWMLVALAPVLALPFGVSTATWLVLHVFGAIACIVLAWKLFVGDSERPPLPVVLLGLAFVPFVEDLLFGQLGTFLAVCLLGGMLALRREQDALAGVCFALLIVKPQVAILPLVVVALHVIACRRWRTVWAGVATIAALVLPSLVLFPDAWAGWSPLGGDAGGFASATAASWLRDALPGRPDWPLVVVPLGAVLVTIAWWWERRPAIRWEAVPVLLALSLLFAPRAFVYDSMLLLPIHVLAVASLLRGGNRALGVAALALQGVTWWVVNLPNAEHHHLVFLPALMVLLALAVTSTSPPVDAAGAHPLLDDASR